jgi:hypothetical protein
MQKESWSLAQTEPSDLQVRSDTQRTTTIYTPQNSARSWQCA